MFFVADLTEMVLKWLLLAAALVASTSAQTDTSVPAVVPDPDPTSAPAMQATTQPMQPVQTPMPSPMPSVAPPAPLTEEEARRDHFYVSGMSRDKGIGNNLYGCTAQRFMNMWVRRVSRWSLGVQWLYHT